ncbi:MAG: Era-like GTP-binding protein [Candidatus Thermoplasmatota archaeon]|nr:Era-like GTP-binding protein [Candidatus Thermoplasmatota archaeon]
MAIGQKLRSSGQRGIMSWVRNIFGKKQAKIGIYGPPNAGKTTLANRLVRDWAGDVMGAASATPHETRRARRKSNIQMVHDGASITLDIVDTPGIATKIDFHEFVEDYGYEEAEAKRRAKEATEGVVEAIRWLDDVDGVILVMDSTLDPFNQVNVTILGNLEARRLPVVIAANKIDLEDSSPATLKNAFPQHPVVPISAISGYNIDQLYRTMIKSFR